MGEPNSVSVPYFIAVHSEMKSYKLLEERLRAAAAVSPSHLDGLYGIAALNRVRIAPMMRFCITSFRAGDHDFRGKLLPP